MSDGFPYQSKDETHGHWSQFKSFLENLSWSQEERLDRTGLWVGRVGDIIGFVRNFQGRWQSACEVCSYRLGQQLDKVERTSRRSADSMGTVSCL